MNGFLGRGREEGADEGGVLSFCYFVVFCPVGDLAGLERAEWTVFWWCQGGRERGRGEEGALSFCYFVVVRPVGDFAGLEEGRVNRLLVGSRGGRWGGVRKGGGQAEGGEAKGRRGMAGGPLTRHSLTPFSALMCTLPVVRSRIRLPSCHFFCRCVMRLV